MHRATHIYCEPSNYVLRCFAISHGRILGGARAMDHYPDMFRCSKSVFGWFDEYAWHEFVDVHCKRIDSVLDQIGVAVGTRLTRA